MILPGYSQGIPYNIGSIPTHIVDTWNSTRTRCTRHWTSCEHGVGISKGGPVSPWFLLRGSGSARIEISIPKAFAHAEAMTLIFHITNIFFTTSPVDSNSHQRKVDCSERDTTMSISVYPDAWMVWTWMEPGCRFKKWICWNRVCFPSICQQCQESGWVMRPQCSIIICHCLFTMTPRIYMSNQKYPYPISLY